MADGNPESRCRGVPAKREAILLAAKKIFFQKGFRAAGMEAIARSAGVSKQTVYSHFGSKEALFEAMVSDRVDGLVAPTIGSAAAGRPIRDVLTDIARGFIAFYLDPESIGLFRVVVAESGRFPKMAHAVYRAGPERAADALAAYLGRQAEKGLLTAPDSRSAARFFFGMLRGDIYMRALLGVDLDASRDAIDALAREAVAVFLRAYGSAEA